MRALMLSAAIALSAAACDDEPETTPAASGEAAGEETAGTAEGMAQEAPPPNANEACARVLVVAWNGADYAADTVTRSKEAARARAGQLRERIAGGADFADVARAESDAASTAPRGGMMGTYTRADWPRAHAPIRDAIFALHDGELSDILEAPYGWVVAQRCPIEKVHTRHVLVRYRGAKNAPPSISRTRDEARALATQIHQELTAPGADFEAVARERSEDASAARGGDIGNVGRGRLEPEYEQAAFALAPGAVSDVVETEVGFHVIQRVE